MERSAINIFPPLTCYMFETVDPLKGNPTFVIFHLVREQENMRNRKFAKVKK